MGKAIRRQLGGRVRARRLAVGLTQAELSERAGNLSPEMVSRIERGEGCSLDVVESLARALKVGVADLFHDSVPNPGLDLPPKAMRVARLLADADGETVEAVLGVAQVLTRKRRRRGRR